MGNELGAMEVLFIVFFSWLVLVYIGDEILPVVYIYIYRKSNKPVWGIINT